MCGLGPVSAGSPTVALSGSNADRATVELTGTALFAGDTLRTSHGLGGEALAIYAQDMRTME